MNVVLVQHGDRPKKYCFEIDDSLVQHASPGTTVICDTRRGHGTGKIVSEVMTGDKATEALNTPGITFPLKKVLAITKIVDISNVLIPIQFELSNPSKVKILERKQELKTLGYVRTNIVIKDEVLTDGYTAYLAGKELGMSKIHVRLSARKEHLRWR